MRKWDALCRSPIYDSSFTSSRSKLIQCLISTFYLKDNFYLKRSKQETSRQLCVLPFKNLNILTYKIYFLSSNIQQPSCKKTFRCFNNFPLFPCPKHVYTKLSKSLKHSKMFQILLLNGWYRNSCSIDRKRTTVLWLSFMSFSAVTQQTFNIISRKTRKPFSSVFIVDFEQIIVCWEIFTVVILGIYRLTKINFCH